MVSTSREPPKARVAVDATTRMGPRPVCEGTQVVDKGTVVGVVEVPRWSSQVSAAEGGAGRLGAVPGPLRDCERCYRVGWCLPTAGEPTTLYPDGLGAIAPAPKVLLAR